MGERGPLLIKVGEVVVGGGTRSEVDEVAEFDEEDTVGREVVTILNDLRRKGTEGDMVADICGRADTFKGDTR